MEKAAKMLNLRRHEVGVKNLVSLYGPADIEGHKSKQDGKYYLCDFARLMPTQMKIRTDKHVVSNW
jgi:hypothetical protein